MYLVDWDDTLFPTSSSVAGTMPPEDWGRTCRAIETFLTTALRHGRVYIVTNSEQGWVQLSATRHVPELAPTLRRVEIVSARTSFERRDGGGLGPSLAEQTRWKFLAMLRILRGEILRTRRLPLLVQIGDSDVERTSLLRVAERFPDLPPVKSIQLAHNPSAELLRRQLDQICGVLPLLARSHPTIFDVQLSS